MAIDFLGAVDFFVVRDRVKEVVNAFGIDSFPQVVLLPGGDKEAVIHDGAMLRDDIFEFISGFKKPLEAAKPSAKASKTKISAKLSATEETKKAAKSATEKAKEKAEDATETAKESAEEPKPTKKGIHSSNLIYRRHHH